MWETHDLVLVPGRVNDQDFILGNLSEILSKKEGWVCEKSVTDVFKISDINEKNGSHWILVTKQEILVPPVNPDWIGRHLTDIRDDFKMKDLPYDLLPILDVVSVVLMRCLLLNNQKEIDGIRYDATTPSDVGPGSRTGVEINVLSTGKTKLHCGVVGTRAAPFTHVLASRVF